MSHQDPMPEIKLQQPGVRRFVLEDVEADG